MNLVLTIAIGTMYEALSQLTHHSIKAYAQRIGADFKCINHLEIAQTTAHWEKYQIGTLLEQYDRVLYLDTDLIIRDDCPDLFKLVPEHLLGAFNEAPFVHRSRELLIDVCRQYGVTLAGWNGKYWNSGVLAASQCHKSLFVKPAQEVCSFYEQTSLNVMIALHGIEMYELPYELNRMSCMDEYTGEHRLASHIVHYAGAPNMQMLFPLIKRDLHTWEDMHGDYNFTRHIHIVVSGGLGDQTNAEPAIRFMKQYVYPNDSITVTTHFPELFSHLDVDVYKHGEFQPAFDVPYYTVQSLPPPESVTWMVLSNLLCHTVDYCSAALLRRILPLEDKRVHLMVRAEDMQRLQQLDADWTDLVVVHAGRHWVTKTFPVQWWQDVVDSLDQEGYHVCLVGQDEHTRGVLPIRCPEGGLDLRNKLSLGELIALLSISPVLISNDSAPIHLAGAFDNAVVLIPSCKHPQHILPWRHGSLYWNADAPYKKLTIDAVSARPTDVHGSSAEFAITNAEWYDYLPDVSTVIEAVTSLSGARLMRNSAYARE